MVLRCIDAAAIAFWLIEIMKLIQITFMSQPDKIGD